MSTNIRRSAVAAFAAGAMTLTMASSAFAALDDSDGSPVVAVPAETVMSANIYRIADTTRILTAIEASQSRTDWGDIEFTTNLVWDCSVPGFYMDGAPVGHPDLFPLGSVYYPIWGDNHQPGAVMCTVVVGSTTSTGSMDIIIARDNDYSDALAASPLADVVDAPILLNPTDALNADVRAEIARLAALAGGQGWVTVHLLGGTNALSASVETSIDAIANVDRTLRYQGIDRYQTAVNIAEVTIDKYGLESGADGNDANVYLTTGINFPDALSAGAAAANNDGVVLLTKGTVLDARGFTDQFLQDLETWVWDENWDINTSEIFAVGGPSATAAAAFDIRLANSFVGVDRYETATKTAVGTFPTSQDIDNFAVVSGEAFPDALVASGFIANLDGPLLLTRATSLTPVTADYLKAHVGNGDNVFTFGGPDSLRLAVTTAIADLLKAKFAINPEIA